MLPKRKIKKQQALPTRKDYRRNLSVRMTEEQYRQLQRYMGLTRLKSTAYFCRLIRGDQFRGYSPQLNHAMHASANRIYSNVRQISRHRRAKEMDAEAAGKMNFLIEKICEEIYLLANQK